MSGDDYSIVRQCDDSVVNRFMIIGGFVAVIFIMCFVSTYYAFARLFASNFIAVPIAIFFALMIINIYLLLLYTFSKNSFPSISDNKSRIISIIIRVIFICFLAIIISKPIESFLFSSQLSSELIKYKTEQIYKYTSSTKLHFEKKKKTLNQLISNRDKHSNNIKRISIYENILSKEKLQSEGDISSMIRLVNSSNYFIQSIIILNTKYKFCWIITLIMIFFFLYPVYIKTYILKQNEFNKFKKEIELRIVKDEYTSFKYIYKILLVSKFSSTLMIPDNGKNKVFLNQSHKEKFEILNREYDLIILNIEYSEPYEDAPFNTLRKKDKRDFLEESDLISDLYGG